MLVWGGEGATGDYRIGGRYDPLTDSWTPTSMVNAPVQRSFQSNVWTGDEMIIWGGNSGGGIDLNEGGRYDPINDIWLPTSRVGAPSKRYDHSAVWTGSEMIVWGGYSGNSPALFQNGGRYDPVTDTWGPVSLVNAPLARERHSAFWTGSRMLIWGGWPTSTQTGGLYDPVADSWIPTSLTNVPEGRLEHAAVWTGESLIVWGGHHDSPSADLNSGARYNPATDTWTATTLIGAPQARRRHAAVWTGSEMIIWGGNNGLVAGGRYDPTTDVWVATTTTGTPSARSYLAAVWTGREMMVWGGIGATGEPNTGGRYFLGPAEIRNMEWQDFGGTLEWDVDPAADVRYDVVLGDIEDLSAIGSSPSEQCLANDQLANALEDPSPAPLPGRAWYFLVRGSNFVGPGTYGCDSSDQERLTPVCP